MALMLVVVIGVVVLIGLKAGGVVKKVNKIPIPRLSVGLSPSAASRSLHAGGSFAFMHCTGVARVTGVAQDAVMCT